MKSGGEISTIEQHVPNWGGGADAHVGDILMADGTMDHKEAKDVEWEVSFDYHSTSRAAADKDQVYVIDDKKTKNAFVTPGGKIFVFTGILPVSGNDDGLATVLGHEVAHQGQSINPEYAAINADSNSAPSWCRENELNEGPLCSRSRTRIARSGRRYL